MSDNLTKEQTGALYFSIGALSTMFMTMGIIFYNGPRIDETKIFTRAGKPSVMRHYIQYMKDRKSVV